MIASNRDSTLASYVILEQAGWSTADFWLRRQTAYDLVQARKDAHRIKVERYQPQVVG